MNIINGFGWLNRQKIQDGPSNPRRAKLAFPPAAMADGAQRKGREVGSALAVIRRR